MLPRFETQPHLKALNDLWIIKDKMKLLKLSNWNCLPANIVNQSWPWDSRNREIIAAYLFLDQIFYIWYNDIYTYIRYIIYIYIYILHHKYKHLIEKEKTNKWVHPSIFEEWNKNIFSFAEYLLTLDEGFYVLLNSGWRGTKFLKLFFNFKVYYSSDYLPSFNKNLSCDDIFSA